MSRTPRAWAFMESPVLKVVNDAPLKVAKCNGYSIALVVGDQVQDAGPSQRHVLFAKVVEHGGVPRPGAARTSASAPGALLRGRR